MKKKTFSKILSLFLTVVFLLNTGAMLVSAEDAMTIQVSTVNAAPGETVQVQISLADNPGISSLKLKVAYDEVLTLTNVEFDSAFGAYVTAPQPYANPQTLNLISPLADIAANGTYATLTFSVAENAADNTVAVVSLSFDPEDIFNTDYDTIAAQVENGSVKIYTGIPGDIDGDKKVNNKDAIALFRYVADWDVAVDFKALDVNGDNKINNKDAITLFRFVAGWDGILLHYGAVCAHELTAHEAVEATCTEDGNITYWECTKCGRLFNSENAVTEIMLIDTVVPALGHTPVMDEAVPATETTTGLTEGSHCAVCNQVLVAQEIVPILVPHTANITYKMINNDSYLASQEINNPNPSTYVIGKGLTLSNDVEVPGYTFLGWYDSFASNATQIKSIPASATEDITLYAHWERYEYTIQYESDLLSEDDDTYTVNQSKQLPTPQLDGYLFVGWSDGDGNIIRRIPAGTTGDKIYSANWMSERNKASTKKKIDAPYIFEDEETDTILFTYEIGQIENVPLYIIEDFGYINTSGVSKTVSKEYSVKTNTTLMEQYTKTVANSTTNTSQWSLSDGWTDSVTVSENYLQENNLSETDAKTLCTTDSSNWLVSSGSSGSSTTTTYNSSQDYDLHTATDNTKTYNTQDGTVSKTHKQSADLKLGAKEYLEVSAGGNIKAVKVEGKGGIETTQELDLGYEGEHTKSKATKTGTESDDGNQDQTGSVKHTGTDTVSTGGWNRSSSYGGSRSVSNSESVSKTVSERIATEKGYGKTYILSGNTEETQGLSSSSTDSDAYSSAVTYGTEETTTETITYSTSNTKTGYHRLVKAGTAHVFAVVGYDIKTASYFVNTYTVMDDPDKYYNFEDYSYTTAAYDDNQISVIPFEVPYEVEEYVLSKVGETEGLEFNKSGMITGYTGSDTTVVIPEYHVVDNLDGTKSVIKVTSISPTAFRGNESITGVQLSDYTTDIPANAFEGCDSLELICMPGVTNIGASAFKDCAFDTAFLSQDIESLGDNAFENINTFAVYTNRKGVAEGATNSGAKNILIYVADSCDELNDTHLTVGDGTEIFVFCGRGNSFNNLSIDSNADAMVINRATIQSSKGVPIKASSDEVQLEQVNINSAGFSMILTNENSVVNLYGESTAKSSKGNAILCRNVNVVKTDRATQKGVFSELEVDGNILHCGSHAGDSLVTFASGNYVSISHDEFNKYLNGVYTLTYDANGGTMSETSKSVYYGETIGDLAEPTRTGFTFDGWYTEINSGSKITTDTVAMFDQDATIYAHWVVNAYSVNWNTGTGFTIAVTRTSSPNKGASTGAISSGAAVYYGDVLSISYTPSAGYSVSSHGVNSITVSGNVTSSEIYATASVLAYSASWTASGTGYSIKVSRTSSPKAGAATGTLTSGTTVYYGDTLSVTYTPSTGYKIDDHGSTSITVTGNINSNHIWARASRIVVNVPGFTGWGVNDARYWLENNGINVNTSYSYNCDYAANTVYGQSASGNMNYGSTVTLYVSSGPKPYAVGDYVCYAGGTYLYASVPNGGGKWKPDACEGWINDITWYNGVQYIQFAYQKGTGFGWASADHFYQKTN